MCQKAESTYIQLLLFSIVYGIDKIFSSTCVTKCVALSRSIVGHLQFFTIIKDD